MSQGQEHEEAEYLRLLQADPDNVARREAYAHWLEARGDVRAHWVRTQLELWREPLQPRRGRELYARSLALAKQCDPQWLQLLSRVSLREIRRRVERLSAFAAKIYKNTNYEFRLQPPLPLAQVEQAEASLGVRLPEQYRRFITELANGSAGDLYGILPFEPARQQSLSRMTEPFPVHTSPEDSPRHSAPPGALQIRENGCGSRTWLILAGEDRGFVWDQWSGGEWFPELVAGHSTSDEAADLAAPRAAKLEFADWFAQLLNYKLRDLCQSVPDGDEVFQLAVQDVLELNFSGRGLTELPQGLRGLRHLRTLHLQNNRLTALPDWLGELSELQSLDLSSNPLCSLPDSLGQLRELLSLRASHCSLESLPSSIGQLRALQRLDLSNNQLTSLPESLGELTALDGIRIEHNRLTTLPASFGRLTLLETLNLSNNPITDLPEELSQLMQISELYLDRACLRLLPVCVARLPALELLLLNHNRTLDVADACRQLQHTPRLRELQLIGCELSELPPEIGLLKQLRTLNVSHNRLSALPATFANLEGLRAFDGRYNALTGNEWELDQLAGELLPTLYESED